MSRMRMLSKLIIPAALLSLYFMTLISAIRASEEPAQAGSGEQVRILAPVSSEKIDTDSISGSKGGINGDAPVVGIQVGDESRAYQIDDFGPGVAVVNDVLGGAPLVIFIDRNSNSAAAYFTEINDQVLKFVSDGHSLHDEGGSTWNMDGKATGGALSGLQLKQIGFTLTEWGKWLVDHPQTSLYGH